MQTWSQQRPSLAERFWSLAEAAERGAIVDRSRPVGVVRHILDILAELEAGRSGGQVALSTRAFLADLVNREAMGDLSYVAPERAQGSAGDERALVYSIGILLFEGLTGRHPSGAIEGPRRVGRLSQDELVALIGRSGEVPAALRGVLGRATCPDPAERYASVAALCAELEWFVVTEEEGAIALPPVKAKPAPLPMPPVLVDPDALVRGRPRSAEVDLETALVPRLSLEDLQPRKRRADPPRVVPVEVVRPRRFERPRPKRGEALKLVLMAAALMLASAAATATVMFLVGR